MNESNEKRKTLNIPSLSNFEDKNDLSKRLLTADRIDINK